MTVHDKKLIALPTANALTGIELIYCLQDGLDKQLAISTVVGFSSGDVHGPAPGASTDNHIARWNGATGKLLKDSVALLSDTEMLLYSGSAPGGRVGFATKNLSGVAGSYCGYYAEGPGAVSAGEFIARAANMYLVAYAGPFLISNEDPGKPISIQANGGVIIHLNGLQEKLVTLTDAATVSVNAALGNVFELTALGNRTLLAPTNPPATGLTQKMVIRHIASGGSRSLTLTTGSSNSFRFGTTIPNLTATASGATDYIGCVWNEGAIRWDVVSYSKGF